MKKLCKKKLGILVGVIVLILVSVGLVVLQKPSENIEVTNPNDQIIKPNPSSEGITNFKECEAAGNPVKESYPRQCTTADGKNFRENVKIEKNLCIVSGCNSEICASEEVNTFCEWKEKYACYKDALCERQLDGECGWTMTEELAQCLDQAIMNGQPIEIQEDVVEVKNEKEEVKEDKDEDKESDITIKDRLISWGHEDTSGRTIDTVILHSSYNSLGGDEYDVEKIIDIYKQYGVGAHYIIDRDGIIYQLVKDADIAYHAGVSSLPDGRTSVNQVSIGIEIVNNKEDEMTDNQYEAVNGLIEELHTKYALKYILGHDDIAPKRKTDPWNIQWERISH